MAHKGVRIPFKHFADVFWPLPEDVTEPPILTENPFSKATAATLEQNVAEAFRQAVAEHNLTPGMDDNGVKEHKIEVDGAFFRDDVPDIPGPTDNRPHYPDQVVPVKFERGYTVNDPFSDGADPTPAAESRKAHRVAFFVFVIVGNLCRITRWDRSGATFTVSINYYEKWRLFCETLWRMSQCSDEQLGRDPTPVRTSPRHLLYPVMDLPAQTHPEEIDHMERPFAEDEPSPSPFARFHCVRDLFCKSISNGAPRYALEVPHEGTVRHFLVGNAAFKARGMTGRATRGFVAYDAKTGELVWVKDSWRADHLCVQHEGQILQELNDANVPYVPTVLCYKTVTCVAGLSVDTATN
ncbi:hypothetical protein C8Q70DRAFT_1056935 [Cubamyces menziesii]|nr:hypothetical protein C8Q70DRAFT_1056935 [Cubamyces menziesii]